MKRIFTLLILFAVANFTMAQPWDVTLTIIDPGNGHENVKVKSAFNSWVEHAMVSDANPNPTTWTYTYSIDVAGDYEWGAFADGIDWLLNEPYGTHDGNLSFSVDASGAVTGETSFTLNVLTETLTFYVDMNTLITSGTYIVGNYVQVRGNFNGWNSDYALTDGDDDGIYSLTTGIVFYEGLELEFKYVHGTGGENWEGLDNRTYTVVAGTNNYCAVFDVAGSDCTGVGVNDISDTNVSIYPNPSNGIFQLSGISEGVVEVLDITGKTVLKQVISGQTNIDLTAFQAGIYFVKVNSENKVLVKKVVLK